MDSFVSPKDEIWFLCVCHHISNAVYLHSSISLHGLVSFFSLPGHCRFSGVVGGKYNSVEMAVHNVLFADGAERDLRHTKQELVCHFKAMNHNEHAGCSGATST
jgi:hypothetical protein